MTAEKNRLADDRESWIAWGPYLSERQWGTVREDYSHDGNAWSHFTHDDAAAEPIVGARTGSADSAIPNNASAWPSRCGMEPIRSSRNDSSG